MAATGAGTTPEQSQNRVWWAATAGFALLLALTFAALVVVGQALDASRDARDAVTRNRDALDLAQQILLSLQDAETGQRGYVITGNEVFLEPYLAARGNLDSQIIELGDQLTVPESAAILAELNGLIREQLAFYEALIALRRTAGFAPAAAQVGSQVGKRRMDAMRQLLARFRAIEERELADLLALEFESSARNQTLIQGLVIAAVLIVLVIGSLLLRDIRRRQLLEARLSEANALLNTTMDSASQGIAVFDPELRLLAWNSRFAELRGIDPGEVRQGMSFDELVAKGYAVEDLTGRADGSSQAVTREAVYARLAHAKELQRADGKMLEVRGQLRADGTYVLTYTDITPLKRSEIAYRDQAVRLASTLDAVVDAIITINESGSIESWSKGAERLFGYTAQQVIRRNVSMLMPQPHAAAHDGYLRHYIATGEKRIIGTRRAVEARHRDGFLIPVDLGISEMIIGDRRLFIGVVRDISERLQVERLKNEFVSTVSHELRTPLTSISGALGLLAGGVTGTMPPKARRLIDIAKQNSDRLVRLINDILDLEKAESGRLEFRLSRLALRPIVQAAIEANRALGEARRVHIELAPHSVDGIVQVDRDRLIQVITNLLSNAIKFSPDDGKVTVAIERLPDVLRIAVRDTGPGIPAQFRSRIFQKFAQADSSDSRSKGGTGLGLSIVHAIIERLGGNVSFVSESGVGTTFFVALPEWHDMAVDTEYQSAHAARVLVCEDDPDVAAILGEVLRNAQLQPVVVPTMQAAMEAVSAGDFDVALVDLNLPDASGLDLIARLRKHPRAEKLPVIVVTARATSGSAEMIHSLQLADWMQKPIDPDRLLQAVHVAINGGARHYRVLHVEDDHSLGEMVRALLETEADVTNVRSLAEARVQVARNDFDLVILDIALDDGSGLDLLPELRRAHRIAPPVVLYSASEATRDVASQVAAALVKSRDSVETLLATVRRLAARNRGGHEHKEAQ